MSEYNITDKDKELLELIKPIQNWLLDHYDPMCKIEITDSRIKVYRSELHLLQNVYDERESEDSEEE